MTEKDEEDGPEAEWLGSASLSALDPVVPPPPVVDISERLKLTRAFHNTPIDKLLIRNAMGGCHCGDEACDDTCGLPLPSTVAWAERVEAYALAREVGVPWYKPKPELPKRFQGPPGV